MSEQTKIAWADSTVNFWIGCEMVSAGCANCYADAQDQRRFSRTLGAGTKENPIRHWGKDAPRHKVAGAVRAALAMNRKPFICSHCGTAYADGLLAGKFPICGPCIESLGESDLHRRRIFSLSLGDWLDDAVPIEWLAEMLDTIRQCDQVTWILCTKRPENFKERLTRVMMWFENTPCTKQGTSTWNWILNWVTDITGVCAPKNIILLTSVENQEQADKRIPALLNIPAACRGLSLEPLLGPVNLEPSLALWKPRAYVLLPRNYINWLIIGGESGTNARPCNVDWIRSLVAQGNSAGVATFVKQLGAKPVETQMRVGSSVPGDDVSLGATRLIQDKKGGDPSEWPADLRVQEWPKGF